VHIKDLILIHFFSKIQQINNLDQQLFEYKQKQAELAQRLVANSLPKDDYVQQRRIVHEKAKDVATKLQSLSQF
jgi:hypothetical protein